MVPPLSEMAAPEISLLLRAFAFLAYVCPTLEIAFVAPALSIHTQVESTLELGNSHLLLRWRIS